MPAYAYNEIDPGDERWLANRLNGLEPSASPKGPGQYWYAREGQVGVWATIGIEDDWLVTARRFPNLGPGCFPLWLWRELARSSAPASGARAVLMPGDRAPRMRAEIPIAQARALEPPDLASWLDQAHADVTAPARGSRARRLVRRPRTPGFDPDFDLAAPCVEAGWTTARRRSGEIVVTLPGRYGDIAHAVAVVREGIAEFRVFLDLPEQAATSDATLKATVTAMLHAVGSVHQVRAQVGRDRRRLVAALALNLRPPLRVATLDAGLAALALASRQLQPELEALSIDTRLAAAYLRSQWKAWPGCMD